jgi:hypothetical protein
MINKNGTIKLNSVIAEQNYRVIETKRGQNNNVWSAIDTIKNETNGNIKTMTRLLWKKLFDKYNLKSR